MKLNKKLIMLASAITLVFGVVSLPSYADDAPYTVTNGQGMVGPNLADSLKLISKEQFFDTLEDGQIGVEKPKKAK